MSALLMTPANHYVRLFVHQCLYVIKVHSKGSPFCDIPIQIFEKKIIWKDFVLFLVVHSMCYKLCEIYVGVGCCCCNNKHTFTDFAATLQWLVGNGMLSATKLMFPYEAVRSCMYTLHAQCKNIILLRIYDLAL